MYSTVPTGEMADSCRMLMVSPKSPWGRKGGGWFEWQAEGWRLAEGTGHAPGRSGQPPLVHTSLTRPASSMKMFSSLMSLREDG